MPVPGPLVNVALADGRHIEVSAVQAVRVRGIDADGDILVPDGDPGDPVSHPDGGEYLIPLTPCCHAIGKRSADDESGTVCSSCHREVDSKYGRHGTIAVSRVRMVVPEQLRAALREFEIRASADQLKTDDELVHATCGETVCDVEDGDALWVLIEMVVAHTCPSTRRRPYLEFRDENRILLGLTGPYRDRESAQTAMNSLMQAEEVGVDGLDLDSVPPEGQCVFAPYQLIRVVDLSPDEIERTVQGRTRVDPS